MATLDALDRLATLAAQRTARTDRLHEAVCALLARLEKHVAPRASVTADSWTLARIVQRSNIGELGGWSLSCGEEYACDPSRPVGGEGYVHGDFHCPWVGPTR